MSSESSRLDSLRQRIATLQLSVYSQPDPAANAKLLSELLQAQQELHQLEHQQASVATSDQAEEDKPTPRGRFLGATTTGLSVASQIRLDPLPTGVYQLMDPETDSLVSVEIENHSRDTRRVCVKAYVEGISAQAVRTVELAPSAKEEVHLLPTLFPEQARAITEVQRATLHVIVDDLDGKLESHNTHTITCLSRTASFNSVRRPDTGEVVDLSHYYGAWVTPYVDWCARTHKGCRLADA